MVYGPREDVGCGVGAPYAFRSDRGRGGRVARVVRAEGAAERGPRLAVQRADELARIDRQGKQTLRRRIEREFNTDRQRSYNDRRWGPAERVDGV